MFEVKNLTSTHWENLKSMTKWHLINSTFPSQNANSATASIVNALFEMFEYITLNGIIICMLSTIVYIILIFLNIFKKYFSKTWTTTANLLLTKRNHSFFFTSLQNFKNEPNRLWFSKSRALFPIGNTQLLESHPRHNSDDIQNRFLSENALLFTNKATCACQEENIWGDDSN